jgi:hypothetical protein
MTETMAGESFSSLSAWIWAPFVGFVLFRFFNPIAEVVAEEVSNNARRRARWAEEKVLI